MIMSMVSMNNHIVGGDVGSQGGGSSYGRYGRRGGGKYSWDKGCMGRDGGAVVVVINEVRVVVIDMGEEVVGVVMVVVWGIIVVGMSKVVKVRWCGVLRGYNVIGCDGNWGLR
ncbi:hypothetical protein TSUD_360610 [Trifolium subterraneum]|uniref:Uncharacterized protein n=1 Tax=Trifolium subterraneum TaxID=3900 RepID=A0A2Z6MBE8_TRISU|nr:hypothetical protein TSUD_360610 [Trifolium subterraneum]